MPRPRCRRAFVARLPAERGCQPYAPQEILSFIPTNPFADLAGARSTSTIAVVIFSAILGVAYIRLRDKDVDQADFFKSFIDSLYGIVMRIVAMVLGLTPYGILALIAKVMAASGYRAHPRTGKVRARVLRRVAGGAVRALSHLAGEPRKSGDLLQEGVSRAQLRVRIAFERGALPLNIETQHKALGVDSASGDLAASFGCLRQNGARACTRRCWPPSWRLP